MGLLHQKVCVSATLFRTYTCISLDNNVENENIKASCLCWLRLKPLVLLPENMEGYDIENFQQNGCFCIRIWGAVYIPSTSFSPSPIFLTQTPDFLLEVIFLHECSILWSFCSPRTEDCLPFLLPGYGVLNTAGIPSVCLRSATDKNFKKEFFLTLFWTNLTKCHLFPPCFLP